MTADTGLSESGASRARKRLGLVDTKTPAAAATPRPAAVRPSTPAPRTGARQRSPRRAVLGTIARDERTIPYLATGVLSAVSTHWVASASFDPRLAWLAPAAIEGTAIALFRIIATDERPMLLTRLTAWLLVGIALACNVGHALHHRPAGLVVATLAGCPAYLLVLVESRRGRG